MLTVYTRKEFFKCLKWSGTKSRYQSVVSAATLRQLGSRYSVEQGRCARRRLYWYNGQSMSTSFARHATLIAGNDTVPVSVWRSRGMRSTKSLCPLVTPPSIGERSIVMSVSICVCVFFVREHIFGTTRPNFTNFLCMLPMAVAQSSSGGVLIRYVLPVYGFISHSCSTSPPS